MIDIAGDDEGSSLHVIGRVGDIYVELLAEDIAVHLYRAEELIP